MKKYLKIIVCLLAIIIAITLFVFVFYKFNKSNKINVDPLTNEFFSAILFNNLSVLNNCDLITITEKRPFFGTLSDAKRLIKKNEEFKTLMDENTVDLASNTESEDSIIVAITKNMSEDPGALNWWQDHNKDSISNCQKFQNNEKQIHLKSISKPQSSEHPEFSDSEFSDSFIE